MPDLRGRVPVGYAASGGHADVSTLGNNEGSTEANRRPKHPHSNTLTLPNHAHSVSDPGHTHVIEIGNAGSLNTNGYVGGTPTAPAGFTENTDSGTTGLTVGNPTTNPSINGGIGAAGTANDAPAYLVLNYIIKT